VDELVYLVTSLFIVVAILAAFIVLRRRLAERAALPDRPWAMVGVWMSVGMLLGGAAGMAIWIATDTYLLWVVSLSVGMTVGLAIGIAREPRR